MAPQMTYTEAELQHELFRWCQKHQHQLITPNTYALNWESDLVSVTGAGYLHEYEIKISRGDYKRDAKKARTRLLTRATAEGQSRPNYFWYVMPAELVAPEELPSYAGLIEIGSDRRARIHRAAPRLHSSKLAMSVREALERSLMYRFWEMREQRTENIEV